MVTIEILYTMSYGSNNMIGAKSAVVNPLEDATQQAPNNYELRAHLGHHSNVRLQLLLDQ